MEDQTNDDINGLELVSAFHLGKFTPVTLVWEIRTI